MGGEERCAWVLWHKGAKRGESKKGMDTKMCVPDATGGHPAHDSYIKSRGVQQGREVGRWNARCTSAMACGVMPSGVKPMARAER